MNATTTCAYSNPVAFDGSIPSSTLDEFAFASSTCTTIQATSTENITFPTSMEVRDPAVIFGLSLVIFLLASIVFFGMFFGKHAQHD